MGVITFALAAGSANVRSASGVERTVGMDARGPFGTSVGVSISARGSTVTRSSLRKTWSYGATCRKSPASVQGISGSAP